MSVYLFCFTCRSARALFDCNTEEELELAFRKDDILVNGELPLLNTFPPFYNIIPFFFPLVVTESDEPDWLIATRLDGKSGLVPANYVELLP